MNKRAGLAVLTIAIASIGVLGLVYLRLTTPSKVWSLQFVGIDGRPRQYMLSARSGISTETPLYHSLFTSAQDNPGSVFGRGRVIIAHKERSIISIVDDDGSKTECIVENNQLADCYYITCSADAKLIATLNVTTHLSGQDYSVKLFARAGFKVTRLSSFRVSKQCVPSFSGAHELWYLTSSGDTAVYREYDKTVRIISGRHIMPSPYGPWFCEMTPDGVSLLDHKYSRHINVSSIIPVPQVRNIGWSSDSRFFVCDTEANQASSYYSKVLLVDLSSRERYEWVLTRKINSSCWVEEVQSAR